MNRLFFTLFLGLTTITIFGGNKNTPTTKLQSAYSLLNKDINKHMQILAKEFNFRTKGSLPIDALTQYETIKIKLDFAQSILYATSTNNPLIIQQMRHLAELCYSLKQLHPLLTKLEEQAKDKKFYQWKKLELIFKSFSLLEQLQKIKASLIPPYRWEKASQKAS